MFGISGGRAKPVGGSPRLKLNELSRELFWLGLEHGITLNVEWVPREKNALLDDLSKLIIPDDAMLSRTFFQRLELRFGLLRWISFRRGRITNATDAIRCIGSVGRRGSTHLRLAGAANPLGSTVPFPVDRARNEEVET